MIRPARRLRVLCCIALAVCAAAPAMADAPTSQPYCPCITPVCSFLINGPAPETDADFANLQQRGIRTIISVDGALPDVERAKAHGIRYVHLPIGYDRMADDEATALAKAVRDMPRPIYIHCYHGKHRSPTAAAVALIELGEMSNKDGIAWLERAGTSHDYVGLWGSVANAAPLPADKLDAAPADFAEQAQVSDFVSQMVNIDRTFERLEHLQANGWQPPPEQPDLEPVHEARILSEHISVFGVNVYSVLNNARAKQRNAAAAADAEVTTAATDAVQHSKFEHWLASAPRSFNLKCLQFDLMLHNAESASASLLNALEANDTAAADRQMEKLDTTCNTCHRRWRN